MKSCCDNKENELRTLQQSQSQTLKIVLWINLVMFFVEIITGILSHSSALMADSLDMLGDTVVYGFSLYVLTKSVRWRAGAALLKGVLMSTLGMSVLVSAATKIFSPVIPVSQTMGLVGGLAFLANLICLLLLLKHRKDDLNMRSTWLCSRNDIIANLGVILAAVCVNLTHSGYPDIIAGSVIALLVLSSSFGVLWDSFQQLKKNKDGQLN